MTSEQLAGSYVKLSKRRYKLYKQLENLNVKIDLISTDLHSDEKFMETKWNKMISKLTRWTREN